MISFEKFVFCCLLVSVPFTFINAQSTKDSAQIDKLRTESGVDPTRVQSRVGYSLLLYDQNGASGQISNKASLTVGINRWSFAMKYESVTKTGLPGTGFSSGFGDIKFSILNAVYVKDKQALAASAEFSVPTGKPGFGSQYFSVSPALTYSYTINPTFIFAIQPQYTFALLKDPLYPQLSVLTIRPFFAKFMASGFFYVLEPRPIFDFVSKKTDLIISPIIGKSLGKGFNLIFLHEYPVNKETRDGRGVLYQVGFNKNF